MEPTGDFLASRGLLAVQWAATLYMTGVIWFVQIVHYPLFALVGADRFAAYEQAHSRLTTWVVMPPMLIEAATAVCLAIRRPQGISASAAWIGLALVVVVWASTFFLQVPEHNRLSLSFHADAHRRLTATNWIRTIAWTIRAVGLTTIVLSLVDLGSTNGRGD
jgi:uncharacterized membrane protein